MTAKVHYTVHLPDELYTFIEQEAAKNYRSVHKQILFMLDFAREKLENNHGRNPRPPGVQKRSASEDTGS